MNKLITLIVLAATTVLFQGCVYLDLSDAMY